MRTFWHNISITPIAGLAFYIILIVAVVTSVWAVCGRMLNAAWKIYYIYKSIVISLYLAYIFLRLFGVLKPTDYRFAVTWLVIFVAGCLAWSSLLHVWERQALIKQIDHDRHPDE